MITHAAQKTVEKYENIIDEVRALYTQIPIDKDYWKHAYVGEFSKKKGPTGLHTAHSYPDKLVKELMLPPDKNGVYAGFYEHDGWRKLSTYYPEGLNRIDIHKIVEEAFANPISKGIFAEIGEAKCGIKVKIIYTRSNDGKPVVLTAFPLYNDEADSRKIAA